MANESLVKTLAEEQNDRIQFVKIRLGTEWYGISIGIVENIVKPAFLFPLISSRASSTCVVRWCRL